MSAPCFTTKELTFNRADRLPDEVGACRKPYMPPKGTASSAAIARSAPAVIQSARIIPLNLFQTYAGSSTDYNSSNKISFNWILRAVYFANNVTQGAVPSQLRIALRTTDSAAETLTGWNDGTALFDQFGSDENFAVQGAGQLAPLWLPINRAGTRIIARFNQNAAIAGDCSVTLLITPQSELEVDLSAGGDPTNPGGAIGEAGCTRIFRPLTQNANGEYVPGDPLCLDPRCINGRMIDYQGNDLGPCP